MPMWLTKAFIRTFPCDGFDPVYGKFDYRQDNYPTDQAKIAHLSLPSTQIRAFFGLPSSLRKDESSVGFSILKDYFYWPEDPNASALRKVMGVLFGIGFLPFRLASVIGSTLVHTLMLVTELLPLALHNLCKEKFGEDSIGAKIFYGIHFVGRAITSPVVNFLAQMKKSSPAKMAGSALLSCAAYAALLPLLPILIPILIPALVYGILYSGIVDTFVNSFLAALGCRVNNEITFTDFQSFGDREANRVTRLIEAGIALLRDVRDFLANLRNNNNGNSASPSTAQTDQMGLASTALMMRDGDMKPLDETAVLLGGPPSAPSIAAEVKTSSVGAKFETTESGVEEKEEKDKSAAPGLT